MWYGHVFRDVQYWIYNKGAYARFYDKPKPATRENVTVSEYIYQQCNLIESSMHDCMQTFWTDEKGNALYPHWDNPIGNNVTASYAGEKECSDYNPNPNPLLHAILTLTTRDLIPPLTLRWSLLEH